MTSEMEVAVWFFLSGGVIGFVLGFLARPDLQRYALENAYERGKADGWVEACTELQTNRPDFHREIRVVK
jgi:hypothetical protein